MKDIVKWGIIGLGNVAHEFAKSFYNIKNAKLIAIASKTQNKLTRFKDEFNINPNYCYNNYTELLKNVEIDTVYIALTNNLHNEWINKSIESNKHILVEKPAFINYLEAQKTLSHPNLKNLFFGEGFMFRYHPQIIKIIELIQNNEIGEPISMVSNFGKDLLTKKKFFGLFNTIKFDSKKRIFNKFLGGGTILDHGSYTVSMSLLIASLIEGVNIKDFNISIDKKKIIDEIDIESSINLTFDNKFSTNLNASFLNNFGSETIINGEKGRIIIKNSWNSNLGKIYLKNDKENLIEVENEKSLYSIEIEKISADIMNNKIEASHPGVKRDEILISSKILDKWINE